MKKAKFSLIIAGMLFLGQLTSCSESTKEDAGEDSKPKKEASSDEAGHENETSDKEEAEPAEDKMMDESEEKESTAPEEEKKEETKKKKEEASVLSTSSNEDTQQEEGEPEMEFTEKEYNFGEVMQKDVVEHTFNFKNAGDAPLVISNARASCGCTVPDWPKDPIAPGESGKIDVKFNTRGKSGVQNKSVTITHNGGTDVVYLKGVVKLPESK